LKVISQSPTDIQPVLDALAESAARLCGSVDASIYRRDGDRLFLVAQVGPIPQGVIGEFFLPLGRGTVVGRSVLDGRTVHVLDLQAMGDEFPEGREHARRLGLATVLAVPLMRAGVGIGSISLRRTEAQLFTPRQAALLETFADQAVIAIENVRLFKELEAKNAALTQAHGQVSEALEQQTATAEILSVISGSPTDIRPVFAAVLDRALTLCEASNGSIYQFEDGALRHVGLRGPHLGIEVGGVFPLESTPGRAVLEKRTVHLEDILQELDWHAPEVQAGVQRAGLRTVVAVPLLREQTAIGAIVIRRREVRPFSEKQIRLLQTFADQAVIAIENVRLFTELEEKNKALTTAHAQVTEALEQQTATSDILRVISRSPTDVQPVFDMLARSARHLCNGEYCVVESFDGERLHFGASDGLSPEGLAAFQQALPRLASEDNAAGRAVLRRTVVQIPDVREDAAHGVKDVALAANYRSVVAAPMLRDRQPIGAIVVARSSVGFFPDRQVALLKTFADQAVIAIENVRLFTELQEKNQALTQAHAQVTEALEQQTATSEILRVISSSPTDVQPVFDTIVRSAMRLLGGFSATLRQLDGDRLDLVAFSTTSESGDEALKNRLSQLSLAHDPMYAQVVRDRAPLFAIDTETDPRVGPRRREVARARGYRSLLIVPMQSGGGVIGAIAVTRRERGPFTEQQIALLQTFADQAVIAIENVRLFKELEQRNRDLTATGEILQVISRSPTDVQPVFDAIARQAMRLCSASYGVVTRYDGELLHLAAHEHVRPEGIEAMKRLFPTSPSRATTSSRAILERTVVHVPDVLADPDYDTSVALGLQNRSVLAVPMLRRGVPIGTISVGRFEPQPFTDTQIALLKTFADQAVIAIENVRLFTELQASNRELTTALDTQTATSDILRVINRSQTDVQPVFDAIVNSAVRLLRANTGVVLRIAGEQIELAASTRTDEAGDAALRASFPRPLQSEGASAQAIRDRAPLNIADAHTDPRFPEAEHVRARVRGYRSRVVVPLLGHDEAVGAIGVTRREPGGFTDAEIALLQTFAAQAVIAIENARLLTELHSRTAELTQSVGELRALGEVGQAISSTLDLQTVLSTIVARATQLSGTDAGVIYEYDEQREIFLPRATEHLEADIVETMLDMPVRKGEGATGRLAEKQEPIQVPDILAAPAESRVRGALVRAGYRALLAVPLVREDHLIGGLTVIRKATGAFPPEIIELLTTFATQSALAIQNARLFREIEEKSRQLEVASQHKSEFLANMSHELRTPLNAIIGFSEVLTDRMFGELNEKQEEYLKDIYASGTHLLSLINDILDLSKIEAGRMELELTDFHLPTALDNALTLVRERAGRRNIGLQMSVDARLGEVRADERKIRQVVLNLLSNAIKFTPEGGRIEVAAVPKDGFVEVLVSDTGVGIAPEDQEAVFEEFRQVGTAEKKAEGTGLGLTLCRKFIELHGGRIWVKSQVGRGSTFTFAIPVRSSQ